MAGIIKAPFNFVPLPGNVFFPKWADQISQDIPFYDALSGTIHLTITAETPMFIGNGTDKACMAFASLPDGPGKRRYFIPATSIKGEVRTILEIMSFSKMRLDRSARFAQRDWKNRQLYTILNPNEQDNIKCGWLSLHEDADGNRTYLIKANPNPDYQKPFRINHKRIDELLDVKLFEDKFSSGSETGVDLSKDKPDGYDPKTAAYKYHLLKGAGIGPEALEGLVFKRDDGYKKSYRNNRVCAAAEGDEGFSGTIVLTGQPNKWDEPYMDPKDGRLKRDPSGGKFYEFVFPEPGDQAQEYTITEEKFAQFEFIYRNSGGNRDSDGGQSEWEFYMERLTSKKGLPVFFRTEGKEVMDFGMAYLYKLPYSRSPYTALPRDHRSDTRHDLAECIFGYVSDSGSLRGRVHFGSAFSDDAKPDGDVCLTLSSPKASYYPTYIRQDGQGGRTKQYATYNDGIPSGWKRYHVRREPWADDSTGTTSEKLKTVIRPVKAGAHFTSDITFHNLRPEELGALLSALTFHNTEGCHHQLGQGKPYGYGKCTYKVELGTVYTVDTAKPASTANYYMARFEKEMDGFIMKYSKAGKDGKKNDWLNSEQMTALITMAHEEVGNGPGFRYMRLDMDKANEFQLAKDGMEYLPPVTELLHTAVHAASLAGELPEGER